MKKSIVLALTSLAVALPVHAQWVVYDPTLHTQSILNTAQEIAKYVEMINNQVQQITTLQNQLTSLNHYIDLFGDPSSVKLPTAATLATDLLSTEPDRLAKRQNRLRSSKARRGDCGSVRRPEQRRSRGQPITRVGAGCRAGRRPSGAATDSANHRWSLTQTGHFSMTKPRASLRSDNCPTSIGMSVRFELEQVSDFVGMRSNARRTSPPMG